MILIIYEREGVVDMRSFRNRDELTTWIRTMNEFGEKFTILHEEVN